MGSYDFAHAVNAQFLSTIPTGASPFSAQKLADIQKKRISKNGQFNMIYRSARKGSDRYLTHQKKPCKSMLTRL